MDKNRKILEEGSFGKLLLSLSLPAVAVILIMLVYNMADTFFIGKTGDPNKISAISICMPVFTILSGISTLFGNGGCTSISIALGEKNEEKVKHITAFCAVGCLVIGLLFFIVVFTFASSVATMLGADESTIDSAMLYLRVFSFASPFVLFSNTFCSITRADGEAVTGMIANICGTVSNIVLDAVFILVFHWDIFGAALATVLGNLISSIFLLGILKTRKKVFLPQMKAFSIRKEICLPVISLGLPQTFSTILSSISSTISNRLMISHGSVCLAAQSVAGKLGMVVTMLIMGICMGIGPALSYNYGRKNYQRVYMIVKKMIIFTVVLGIGLTGLIYWNKDSLIASFIQNEEVIAYGQVFVLASVMVGPVFGIYQTCQTFLQSTGKVTSAIFASLLDKGLIYIPVLLILNYKFGAYGIAFSHAVTMIFTIIITICLSMKWAQSFKTKKKEFSFLFK